MSYPEKVAEVIVKARHLFAGVTAVSDIVPIEEALNTPASAGNFNYLSPVANHLYYIDRITIYEVGAITGLPQIEIYDVPGPTTEMLYELNLNSEPYHGGDFFVSRMRHLVNGATVGDYSIVYSGFDLTYV